MNEGNINGPQRSAVTDESIDETGRDLKSISS